MIRMKNICKSYHVAKRSGGFKQACRTLFRREYETIRALDHVSFTIGDGEMVGYSGPNGAGKSSTIQILSGILTPDSGECLVNGRTPWKDRVNHVRDIGVVFGQRTQLWWDVPVIDSYELLKDIYSISNETYNRNLEELTQLLNLTELWAEDAVRDRGLPAPWAEAFVFGRTHHRTGCGVQAGGQGVYLKAE